MKGPLINQSSSNTLSINAHARTQYVSTSPFPLAYVLPRNSRTWFPPSRSSCAASADTWMRPASDVDSIRDAVLTAGGEG